MTKLIKFEDSEIGTFFIEVDENLDSKSTDVQFGSAEEKVHTAFEVALKPINGIVRKVFNSIKSVDLKPDEIELKLGVKLGADAGIVIAKASTEANIEITLTWKNSQPVE